MRNPRNRGDKKCVTCSRNWAKPGKDYCLKHDPELAEARSRWGRIRHPRHVRAVVDVGGVPFDRAKVPTVAGIVDALLQVHDDLRDGQVDAMTGRAMVGALKAAADVIQRERDAAVKAADGEGPVRHVAADGTELEAALEASH